MGSPIFFKELTKYEWKGWERIGEERKGMAFLTNSFGGKHF